MRSTVYLKKFSTDLETILNACDFGDPKFIARKWEPMISRPNEYLDKLGYFAKSDVCYSFRDFKDGDTYVVEIGTPGVDKSRISASIDDNILNVYVSKEDAGNDDNNSPEKIYSLALTQKDYDIDNITSSYKDGLLKLVIPAKPKFSKTIQIV